MAEKIEIEAVIFGSPKGEIRAVAQALVDFANSRSGQPDMSYTDVNSMGTLYIYETNTRRFIITEFAYYEACRRSLIAGNTGFNSAIIVLDAASSNPMENVPEYIALAKQAKIPSVIVYLNKCGSVKNEEMIKPLIAEINQELLKHDYGEDEATVMTDSTTSDVPQGFQGMSVVEELYEVLNIYT